ncbi:MAG: hypothetical protein Q8M31_08800 [Beijerinckiaceae bacterium]|nr:hypothetical protein [Beijerinckiaceae bacterium]
MKKLLDMIRGDRNTSNTSHELRQAIDVAEQNVTRAEGLLTQARESYESSLLDPDEKASIAAHRTLSDMQVRLDRARILAEKLRAELAEVEAEEAEAERQTQFEAATKLANDAKAALLKYPAAAHAVAAIIFKKVRADVAIAAANKNPPKGAELIAYPEHELRGLPADHRVIVDERIEDAGWWFADGRGRVEESLIKEIEHHNGKSFVNIKMRGYEAKRVAVERRKRLVTTFLPRRDGYHPEGLSMAVRLPGLKPGEAPIWNGWGDFTPETEDDPRFLEFVESVEASWREKPSDPRGPRGEEREVSWLSEDEAADREALAHTLNL